MILSLMNIELVYLCFFMLNIFSLFSTSALQICYRDQAQTYVYEQDSVDSRRGLKRSWTSRKEDGPIPSGSKDKATSEERGTYLSTFILNCTVGCSDFYTFKTRLIQ